MKSTLRAPAQGHSESIRPTRQEGMKTYQVLLLIVAGSPSALSVAAQTQQTCAQLANLKIAGAEITKTADVPAGSAVPASFPPYSGALPAHCRVEGVLHRRTGAGGQEYGIGFALALPSAPAWNGDFLMQGGGGGNGVINYPVRASTAGDQPALDRGFAVASTDTGQ